MKLLIACFSVCAFSFNLINTTPIVGADAVLFNEIINRVHILNKSTKVGLQSLHSPRNTLEPCWWSAFKCFVNETLLLKPADSQNEKFFNTTLSSIHSSQHNVQLLLCNSESDCDKGCYPCMDYPKHPETEFFTDFEALLQNIYRSMLLKSYRSSTP